MVGLTFSMFAQTAFDAGAEKNEDICIDMRLDSGIMPNRRSIWLYII
jgi:hypothetical protein